MSTHDELVVFSHLPWDFVWQRPQHLISRLSQGRRTWFVEEPQVAAVDEPRFRIERCDRLTRVWLEVPGPERLIDFDDPVARDYPAVIAELLGSDPDRTIWVYTPLALPIVARLDHALLVYDVMDDLAAFAQASSALVSAQADALRVADLVFTGGRSIDAGVRGRCVAPVHLFPSGVEPEHFERAREIRAPRERPVAGYVGVIDERADLDLIAGLAAELPDWDVRMVGPVFKVEPAALPQAPNLAYPGKVPYERLPEVMGGFDVALMPFALNAATKSISPTKTLEYLAAGLPVISTRVPDVVTAFDAVVELRDDAAGFAEGCRKVLGQSTAERDAQLAPLLYERRWDTIAARMRKLMERALEGTAKDTASATVQESLPS